MHVFKTYTGNLTVVGSGTGTEFEEFSDLQR
jgi:hypothetical protein